VHTRSLRFGISRLFVLILLATLAACGGGGGGDSSTAPPPNDSTTAPPPGNPGGPQRPSTIAGFVYAADTTSNEVRAYTINAMTGTLSAVPGSPYAAGPGPQDVNVDPALTVDPADRFIYVPNWNSSDVSVYAINDATGELSKVPGSPYAVGNRAHWVSIHPSGKFAYVGSGGFHTAEPAMIWAYTIDAATGRLSAIPGSPFAAPVEHMRFTFDLSGRFGYVLSTARGGIAFVTTYAINATTGALTQVGDVVTTGATAPRPMAITPSGTFAYVVNFSSIASYRVDPAAGTLTVIDTGQSLPGRGGFGPLIIHSSGKFAYEARVFDEERPAEVLIFAIDAATGRLSEIPGSPVVTEPGSADITIHPSGKFAYVANALPGDGPGSISAFALDPATGGLSAIAGSPFARGTHPGPLTIDPTGRAAYVGDYVFSIPTEIFAYTIDTTSGALTSVGSVPAGMHATDITIAGVAH